MRRIGGGILRHRRRRCRPSSERKADIQGFLRQMARDAPRPKGSLMVQLDVDPQSFV
jgi:primosomal protein N' (replication factor Y) (superfamily II helicase)